MSQTFSYLSNRGLDRVQALKSTRAARRLPGLSRARAEKATRRLSGPTRVPACDSFARNGRVERSSLWDGARGPMGEAAPGNPGGQPSMRPGAFTVAGAPVTMPCFERPLDFNRRGEPPTGNPRL